MSRYEMKPTAIASRTMQMVTRVLFIIDKPLDALDDFTGNTVFGMQRTFFDQLAGDVLQGGAISEHTSRLEAGLFWQGYGLRLSGRYTGEATLLGGDTPGSSRSFVSMP